MTTISTDDVKLLRDQTGISVMQCKKALEEAGGDMNKALAILKRKSADIALKKGDRTLGSGTIAAYVHGAGTVGVMLLLKCETDFVAKNEDFRQMAYDLAMHVAALNPEFISEKAVSEDVKNELLAQFEKEVAALDKPAEVKAKIIESKLETYIKERTLLGQPFVKDGSTPVSQLITEAVQKFGENIEVGHFTRYVNTQ